MCGRYTLKVDTTLAERFALSGDVPELQARYNIAPGQELPVVVANSPHRLVLMQWGLVPFWAKTAREGYKLINARAETVDSKPAFKQAFGQRRCLVPATGFYEWQQVAGGKQPYHFELTDGGTFAFAGLYSLWHDEGGAELHSYTIITTTPNDLVRPVHDRMPAMLRREDEARWLDPEAPREALLALLQPYPADAMRAYPVDPRVGSPRYDDPKLLEPIA
jgi:putative SOS response-associated peptidase YedK